MQRSAPAPGSSPPARTAGHRSGQYRVSQDTDFTRQNRVLAYQDSALTDQEIKFADPDREVEDQDDGIKTLSSQIRTVLTDV